MLKFEVREPFTRAGRALAIGLLLVSLVGSAASRLSAQSSGVAFIQGLASAPASPSSAVSVTFAAAQSAGHLNVVVVGWNDTTTLVQSVTDTRGNVYSLAAGPTVLAGVATQAIYYAPNILAAGAGANTVTVAFSAVPNTPVVQILQYSGIVPSSAIDATTVATGTGTAVTGLPVTTSQPNALLLGAVLARSASATPGAGFTQRFATPLTQPALLRVNDLFTAAEGTAIAAHPADLGGGWVSDQSGILIRSNRVESPNFGDGRAHSTLTPPSADYEVRADITLGSTGWGNRGGVRGRDAGGMLGNGYEAYYSESERRWYLDVWSGSNVATLGTYLDSGFTSGTRTVRLRMVGTQITVLVDGVARITVTNNQVSSAGHGGLRNSGGIHDGILIDNFQVTDVAGAPIGNALVQDSLAVSPASYVATATLSSSAAWLVQTVAFRSISGSTSLPTPTNLTATATSPTVVDLSWSASAGATGYNVFRGGQLVGSPSTTSFTDSGLTPSTNYSYTVSAFDGSGGISAPTAAVPVTTPALPDTVAPAVSVTAPSAGATVGGTVTFSASASDSVGVVGVRLQVDGADLGNEIASPPYSASWNTTGVANGQHTLTAIARDAAGNIGTSAGVLVTVFNAPPDTTLPTVAISAPAEGATVSGVVSVTATANDNVGVSAVQFKLDGANFGAEDTTAPFSVSWDTLAASAGSHVLSATARDAAGNVGTATGVTVTVSNTAPPGGFTLANDGDKTVVAGNPVSSSITVTVTPGSGTPGGATYATDSFTGATGSTLASHTPELGGAWVDAGAPRLLNNRVEGVNFGDVRPRLNTVMPTANYEVSADLTMNVSGWGNRAGVRGRDAGGNLGAAYEAYYNDGNGTWRLDKWVGSSPVTLGSFAQAFPAGTTRTLTLAMQGTSITVSVDGVSRIAVTDASIAGAGAPGLFIAGGIHDGILLDNFSVRSVGSGPPAAEPVTLSVSGLPASVSRTLSPSTCSATCTAVLTMTPSTNTPVDTYAVTVTGTSASSVKTTSFNLTVQGPPPDTTPPTVAVTSPANLASVAGTITITASAADNTGVVGVRFLVDNAQVGGEDTTAPYATSWDTRLVNDGSHTLTAIARDAAGNSATSVGISVTVNNAPPSDTTPPTVAITSPANLAGVTGTITISANASDNTGVVGVRFLVDNAQVGAEDTTAPYSTSWDSRLVGDGSHNLTAVARDAAGNSTTSTGISVSVNNTVSDGFPPTVIVTSPNPGTIPPGPVTLTAFAGDDVAVAGVQFRVDGVNVGAEDTSSPFTIVWDASAANGPHLITAVGRDVVGKQTISAGISVTIASSSPGDGPLVRDTFTGATGSTLVAHAPDTGGSWVDTQSAVRILNNKIEGVNFGDARSYNSFSPGTSDYDVSVDVTMNAPGWGNRAGIRGRDAGSLLGDAYEVYYQDGAGMWRLDKWTGSSVVTLGTFSQAFPINTTRTLTLSMRGTTISVYVDGVARITVNDGSVQGAGFAGVFLSGGIHDGFLLDNFVVGRPQDNFAPGAPGTPSATAVGSNRIDLTWPAATDDVAVTGYKVERCQGAGCTTFAEIAAPTATAYSDSSLSPQTFYRYRVRATDAAGNLGPYSAIASATTPAPDLQAPTTPGTPSVVAFNSSRIDLTWTASTDNVTVIRYLLERCTGAGCSDFAQVATPAGPSFSDTNLLPSTSYRYRVRAADAADNPSGYSQEREVTTAAPAAAAPVFVAETHSSTDGCCGLEYNNATLTLNVTGNNRLLIAAWHAEWDGGPGPAPTARFPEAWSVTNNGVPGTPLVDSDGYWGGEGNRRFRVYYWVNPPLGVNTVRVTNPNTGLNELASVAMLFNGVDQLTPVGQVAVDVSPADRSAESETVATQLADLVLHVIANGRDNVGGTVSAGETSRAVVNDNFFKNDAAMWLTSKGATGASTTVSSSGWAPRIMTGAAIVLRGNSTQIQP